MRKNVYVRGGIRLRKALSQAEVASYRAVETLVTEGRIQIDGQIVRSQRIRIDPHKQSVHVNGERIFFDGMKHVVIAVNKPVGVMSTISNPEGRPTLADPVVDYLGRLYNVGHPDIDTSSLLLLTNDGELVNRLAHPPYEVLKTYVARVYSGVKPYVKRRLMEGIELEGGPIKVDVFRVIGAHRDITSVEIVVHEGRNRLMRRMMDQVGYPVHKPTRAALGSIHLDRLQPGNPCRVKGNALKAFYSCVGL